MRRFPAVSAGPPPRSLNSRVFQRRDCRAAAVICGSAALPNATAASTPRSGSRSTSGSTGRPALGSGLHEPLSRPLRGAARRRRRQRGADRARRSSHGSEATEFGVADFLGQQWGMRANYVIAAYNDMTKVHDPAGGDALLIGLEAFIPLSAPIAAGHNVINV